MRARSERLEADADRIEQENEVEFNEQEKERAIMESSYKDMEKSVIQHLHKLRSVLDADSEAMAAVSM